MLATALILAASAHAAAAGASGADVRAKGPAADLTRRLILDAGAKRTRRGGRITTTAPGCRAPPRSTAGSPNPPSRPPAP